MVFSLSTILLIMAAGIFSSTMCELLTWFLVYRKEDFKILKNEIEKLNKKIEKKKGRHVIQSQDKSHEKRLSSFEEQMKSLNQELSAKNMKSGIVVGIFMIGFINVVGTYFQGLVVAKLPFVPFSLFQGITHRNIEGTDFTDCSYLFIYILTAFIWRSNLKKVMGFEVNAPAYSMFEPPRQ